MECPIDGSGQSVRSLLADGPRLTVPYFQRGYAWQREHVERLYTDLVEHAFGRGAMDWYPLGAIIVASLPGNPDFSVADGHQRLVTLSILIALLRDLETEPERQADLNACLIGKDGQPRVLTLEGVQATLLECVQRPGTTRLDPTGRGSDLSPSEDAILENRDWLQRQLEQFSLDERRVVAEFVLERCFCATIVLRSEIAARQLFTTMHDTGLRPQSTDLLKSLVLGRLAGEARDRARGVWESLEASLGRDRIERLFLLISAIKTRQIASGHPSRQLNLSFDFASPEEAEAFVLQQVRSLGARHIDMLRAGYHSEAEPGPVFRRLQYLGWVVRHDTWRLPALHWLAAKHYDDPQTLDFLRRLEALAWLQMIRAEDFQRRDRRYLRLLDEIDRGRALEEGGALTIEKWERESVRAVLAAPNVVRRPYKLFLLLRLNAILEGEDKVHVAPEATVEHVFPQRPAPGSRWLHDFRPGAQANDLRHCLGNLTLLTQDEQNSARNGDFDVKRGVLAASRFALSRQLADHDSWQPAAVQARTTSLITALFRSFEWA